MRVGDEAPASHAACCLVKLCTGPQLHEGNGGAGDRGIDLAQSEPLKGHASDFVLHGI